MVGLGALGQMTFHIFGVGPSLELSLTMLLWSPRLHRAFFARKVIKTHLYRSMFSLLFFLVPLCPLTFWACGVVASGFCLLHMQQERKYVLLLRFLCCPFP